MSNTHAILNDYRRIRPIQRELATLASKKLSKPSLESESKMMGLWLHEKIVFESEDEVNALFDHLIHDGIGGPTTPMERITVKELEALGNEALPVHAALCKAWLNVFRFVECCPGLGWKVEDIWHQQSRLIVDETLGNQTDLTDGIAVMRVVNMGEWSFSTGLQGLTFGGKNLETLEALLLASALVEIAPSDFHPVTFTRAQNLLWSRSVLRAWLRPGSVKLLTIPIEVGKKTAKARKRR